MDFLAWPDYLVLAAFLVISVGIGVYHSLTGGRQKTTSEFIMANRSLKVLPTALSLLVSFQSAIMILGMTAEMYSYGSQFFLMYMFSCTLAILLTIQLAVPWIYRLKLVSVNEYFERRFKSKAVRIHAAGTSIFASVVYMGTAMYAPSAALESATGLPIVVSIPVMAVVAVAYTALGGMRAVIWTDVFQCGIMFGGLLAILIKGLVVIGGFGNVFKLCSQAGRLDWVDWSPDPTVRHTVWGFLFSFSMAWFYGYAFQQSAVQRYSATKSVPQAKLTVALNLPALYILNLTLGFTALVVVAYYASVRCDPLVNGDISNTNQLLPHFVLKMFADAPGFAGLFLATLYGGALSSISSSLSGSAANIWEDILQWKLMHLTESRKALLNRFLVVVLGVAATGLAFVASVVSGPITQIAIAFSSSIVGPIAGLVLLGGLNRHANWKGALIGTITSQVCSGWLVIGSYTLEGKHPSLPHLGIDGCIASSNLTFQNYDDTNSSSAFYLLDESSINATMTFSRPLTNQTTQEDYHGIEKFYSISYMWYSLMWTLGTIFIGSVASFVLKDSAAETKVDDELLMSLRQMFSWRGDRCSTSDKYSDINYNTVEKRNEENGKIDNEGDTNL